MVGRSFSVTGATPRVPGERVAGDRHELPRVGVDVQRQLQHAEGGVRPDLFVRDRRRGEGAPGLRGRSTGAYHELPDAPHRVGDTARVLGREPLVVVVVAGDVELCTGV